MKRFIPLTASLFLFAETLLAADPILASTVKWSGHFGASQTQPKAVLCLMARGFFRSPTSGDAAAFIEKWMREHPKAIVMPVASFGPVAVKDPDSKMLYVWIVDGDQSLNLELVRHGHVFPGTQGVPKDQKLEIPQAEYDAFVKKATEAGKDAEDKKLGVWKTKEE